MRFLDVATALAIGIVGLAALVAWSPQPFTASAKASQERGLAFIALYAFVDRTGLPFLQDSAWSQICSAALAASNATLQIAAEAGGLTCGRSPPPGSAYASLSLDFPGRDLVLQAW